MHLYEVRPRQDRRPWLIIRGPCIRPFIACVAIKEPGAAFGWRTAPFHRSASGPDDNDARALFLSNTAEERVEALDAGVPFHRPFGNRQDDGSGSNRENISSTPLYISGVRPVSTPLAQSSRVYLAVSRRISRITSVERNLKK
jgi:hypothetical protein